MGLDMYLNGEKFFASCDGKRPKEDGFEVSRHELELGYWRKHPNLHGYIVQRFAEGVDECQKIELSEKDMQNIVEAIERKNLPHTEGFFFGVSDESDDAPSVEIFAKAIAWLGKKEKGIWKSVFYRASW